MKIGIFGTGSWGTALAQVLVDNEHDVLIYGKDILQVKEINTKHTNTSYFGVDVVLDKKIKATNDLKEVVEHAEILLLVVPTHAMKSILEQINEVLERPLIFINAAKGFDPETNLRMSQLIRKVIQKENITAVVSILGPSHAEEVIKRNLTLIASVSKNKLAAELVQNLFSNEYFRVYLLRDEIGAEYATAMKNAIALGAGIIDGLGLGDNAKAALITRGLNEMVKFGTYFHAKEKTYLGLTGIGDLVVTCGSKHSRNYQAGYRIGQENSAENVLKMTNVTIEGIRTTKVIYEISLIKNIDLPIISALYLVLFKQEKPSTAINQLMKRSLKEEK